MKMRKLAQGENIMSSEPFASSNFTAGQLNAMVKKLGREGSAKRFLSSTLVINYEKLAQYVTPAGKITLENVMKCVPTWEERDGIFYLTLVSNGTTGPQWIMYFEKKGFLIRERAKDILNSSDFVPTTNIAYNIAIIPGPLLDEKTRTLPNIHAYANKKRFQTPHPEIACLLMEYYSREDLVEMGIEALTIPHPPIKDARGMSCFFIFDFEYYFQPPYIHRLDGSSSNVGDSTIRSRFGWVYVASISPVG